MSLQSNITKEKKDKDFLSIILWILIIGLGIFIGGLIVYGANAAYWGTVVNKYTIEERAVVEYDETLDAEITKIYPARYIIIIESEENKYYQFEVTKYRFNDIYIGSFISTETKAGAERVEKNE